MKKIFIASLFILIYAPLNSMADECKYLAKRYAYDRDRMTTVEIARFSKCVSDHLFSKISGKPGRYDNYYPPPPMPMDPILP